MDRQERVPRAASLEQLEGAGVHALRVVGARLFQPPTGDPHSRLAGVAIVVWVWIRTDARVPEHVETAGEVRHQLGEVGRPVVLFFRVVVDVVEGVARTEWTFRKEALQAITRWANVHIVALRLQIGVVITRAYWKRMAQML